MIRYTLIVLTVIADGVLVGSGSLVRRPRAVGAQSTRKKSEQTQSTNHLKQQQTVNNNNNNKM